MGSYRLPDDPNADPTQQKEYTGSVGKGKLTQLEADYAGFVLYQFGDTFIENEKQGKWLHALVEKLS